MAAEYVLTDGGEITVSREATEKLLSAGSGDAALLYLYILSHGGHYEPVDAAGAIHRSANQVENAMAVLERLGLVAARTSPVPVPQLRPADERPQYTQKDIERFAAADGIFQALVSEVQTALGSVLSSDGLLKLLNIYDSLKLEPAAILMLVNWCAVRYEERYGPGRRPSMRAVEKAAYIWEREGIVTVEAAEDYLRRQSRLRSGEREMAAAIGLSGRNLSATEKRYIDAWLDMGFTPDAVAEAYDRTVVKTGRLTWRYIDSILGSWHAKGIHTAREAAEKDAPPARKEPPRRQGSAREEVTAGEYEQMRATLRMLKGEDGQ